MARRDAGAAGSLARHARNRLHAALGEPAPGLLLEGDGNELFVYRGQAGDGADSARDAPAIPGRDTDRATPAAAGPVLRWRVGLRLAVFLGILAVLAGAWFWWQAASARPEILPLSGISTGGTAPAEPVGTAVAESAETGDQAGTDEPSGNAVPAGAVVVHVAGAVASPGVVRLAAESRVHDAISAAGGGVPGADLNRLNLALVVQDGQKIHVPREGEEETAIRPGAAGQDGSTQGVAGLGGEGGGTPGEAKVNLNTAGVEELDALPKVGPVLAQRIVDWRKEHGKFSSVEELDAVDGVGPKMLEALLPLVTV
ncbi:helix-hairpin-helix domain-containing protein [Pseudarthrobacter sp. NamE5]|uniref:helix-hairpin-helix domain-containing protein n=1 Tax=Pseudarthrobacter sp. NamE5 TaxID=2576839 RepID=UPI00110BD062|nr:helix-hairpin-helix domain-containing protein [Pseudarthrobacter sp. NamE5]TLM87582.1 ComEA family DNA-binding protein [Pseudarthrobacter sp. NamE5]